MKLRVGFFLTLLALSVIGCSTSATTSVPPTEPPALADVSPVPSTDDTPMPADTPALNEVTMPTEMPKPTEIPATDLPALLGRLHWLGHASFRLDAPPVIYIDPTEADDAWPKADVILISHDHSDHYAPAALKVLSTAKTIIITSLTVAEMAKKDSIPAAEIRALKPGENTTVGEVTIAALPAYNVNKNFHPKQAGNLGFIITTQGETLYFAGDTDRIPEMKDLHPDVALLPIGGYYTMDAKEAALAAADLQARVVVPMHNRETDPETFRSLCDCQVVVLKDEK